MIDPVGGPYLFDPSAESWLARTSDAGAVTWLRAYLSQCEMQVSAVTVMERARGYSLLWRRAPSERRAAIETARVAYLNGARRVWPVDAAVGVVAGELMALLPDPPTPPRQTHRLAESRADRVARWRFDQVVAATALVAGLRLIHNSAADFERLRAGVETAPERFPGLGPLELARCKALA